MATPQNPAPASPSAGLTASSIADSGAKLIRLWVAAFTLPINAFNAVGAAITRIASDAAAAIDGSKPASASDNEIVRATGNLVEAGTGLFTSLINAATSGLESLNKSITDAAKGPQK